MEQLQLPQTEEVYQPVETGEAFLQTEEDQSVETEEAFLQTEGVCQTLATGEMASSEENLEAR